MKRQRKKKMKRQRRTSHEEMTEKGLVGVSELGNDFCKVCGEELYSFQNEHSCGLIPGEEVVGARTPPILIRD